MNSKVYHDVKKRFFSYIYRTSNASSNETLLKRKLHFNAKRNQIYVIASYTNIKSVERLDIINYLTVLLKDQLNALIFAFFQSKILSQWYVYTCINEIFPWISAKIHLFLPFKLVFKYEIQYYKFFKCERRGQYEKLIDWFIKPLHTLSVSRFKFQYFGMIVD